MAMKLSQPDNVNVLLSDSNWPWPQAVDGIFRPRGINALVARSADDVLRIIDNNKIHLAILDAAIDEFCGIQTIRTIRKRNKLLPCLLLSQNINHRLLAGALDLNVFSVLAKPVNLALLAEQVNRIFQKCYDSNMFSIQTSKH
jgi:DNA-binding response OmpR family regulator